eukprot:scaffold4009_cov101-Isochrysis_galbana.AAC.6
MEAGDPAVHAAAVMADAKSPSSANGRNAGVRAGAETAGRCSLSERRGTWAARQVFGEQPLSFHFGRYVCRASRPCVGENPAHLVLRWSLQLHLSIQSGQPLDLLLDAAHLLLARLHRRRWQPVCAAGHLRLAVRQTLQFSLQRKTSVPPPPPLGYRRARVAGWHGGTQLVQLCLRLGHRGIQRRSLGSVSQRPRLGNGIRSPTARAHQAPAV